MVVRWNANTAVDEVFHALADTTRRDILRRCGHGELSVSQLAEAYPMSFAAVQKHVAVLQRAGLVRKHRRGREQLVSADPDGVRLARQALDQLELTWRERVDRMSELLTHEHQPPGQQPPRQRFTGKDQPDDSHQHRQGL